MNLPVIATLDTKDTHGMCFGCDRKPPVGALLVDRQTSAHSAHWMGRYCEECLKAIQDCLGEVL